LRPAAPGRRPGVQAHRRRPAGAGHRYRRPDRRRPEGGQQARPERGRAARPAVRLEGGDVREVQRHRLRQGPADGRHRRRPDEPGGQRQDRRPKGRRGRPAGGRLGDGLRRLLPLPRRHRCRRGRRHRRGDPARRLHARRRGDRGSGRARHVHGIYRSAAFPPLTGEPGNQGMNGDQTPLLKYHLIFFACYLGGAILAGFLDPGMGASTVIGIALTLGSAYLALRSFRGDHGRGLDTDERWRMLKVGTIGVTGLTFAGMLFIKAVLESQPLALALGVRLPMWMVVVVSVATAAFTALQLWLIYYLLNERSADGTPAAASTPMPAATRRVAAKAPARRLRVLVIGDDAAAHAVAWKLGQSMQVQEVLIAPGNAGTAGEGKCRNVELPDYSVDALLELARREQVDLTVAGLGSALAGGLVDRFKALDMRVLGPRAAALELEDTGTARRLLSREGVATVGENEPGRLVDVLYMTDGSYAVELAAWEPAPAQGDTASQSPP